MTSGQYPQASVFNPGLANTNQRNALKNKTKQLNQWSRNPQFIPTISEPTLLSFFIKL